MQINSASNNPKINALEAPLSAYLRMQFQLNTLKRRISGLSGEDLEVVENKIVSLESRSATYLSKVEELMRDIKQYAVDVNYGGHSMILSSVPIPAGSTVLYAYYHVYGFDVEKILTDLNLEMLTYFNLHLSKAEVGEMYDIPWHLVDQHKDNFELYTRIITAYTNQFGNEFNLYNRWATLSSGKRIPKISRNKPEETFESMLREAQRTLANHKKAVSDADLEVQSFVRRTTVPKLRGVVKGKSKEEYQQMQQRLFGKESQEV